MAKRAVEIDRRAAEFDGKTLGRDDLEDVASVDVFLGLLDHAFVFLASRVRLVAQFAGFTKGGEWRKLDRPTEVGDELLKLGAGVGVGSLEVVVFVEKDVGDELEFAEPVIEDDERVGQHEDHIGQFQFIVRRVRDSRLEKADHVIGQITNGAPTKDGQAVDLDWLVGRHQLLQLGERLGILLCGEGAGLAIFAHLDFASPRSEDHLRVVPEEGKAADLIALFGGFEEEGAFPGLAEFLERGDGRLVVGGEFGEHRNEVAFFGEFLKLVESWLERNHARMRAWKVGSS